MGGAVPFGAVPFGGSPYKQASEDKTRTGIAENSVGSTRAQRRNPIQETLVVALGARPILVVLHETKLLGTAGVPETCGLVPNHRRAPTAVCGRHWMDAGNGDQCARLRWGNQACALKDVPQDLCEIVH